MVDDLDIARRTQVAPLAPAAGANSQHALVTPVAESLTVRDAVELSARARAVMKELQEGETIAEAWLRQKVAPPDFNDPRSVKASSETESEGKKSDQQALRNAFNGAMGDIKWLLDAIGVDKLDGNPMADAVALKAAINGVGVVPPIAESIARAQSSGSVAALLIENLDVTVQKGHVVDANVGRVTITQVHGTVGDRFSNSDKPVVVDIGGELQQVRVPGAGRDGGGAVTPQARADRAPSVAEKLLQQATPTDDPRHALLIVREGGKLHPEGTVRLKLDALTPIR